ncbi:membrane protein [Beggiatoa sp. PS]|nr:membrane protein [Beggiatoa sp. PS]
MPKKISNSLTNVELLELSCIHHFVLFLLILGCLCLFLSESGFAGFKDFQDGIVGVIGFYPVNPLILKILIQTD